MRVSDNFSSLAADLRALPPRDRRAILSALSAFERAEVSLLIQHEEKPGRKQGQEEAEFRQFSPWLAALLQDAARGSEGGKVTLATAALLADIAADRAVRSRFEAPQSRAPRPSLVAAIAAWLLPASMLS